MFHPYFKNGTKPRPIHIEEPRDLAIAVQAQPQIGKGCTAMPTSTKKCYVNPSEALRALSILRRRGYPQLAGIHWC